MNFEQQGVTSQVANVVIHWIWLQIFLYSIWYKLSYYVCTYSYWFKTKILHYSRYIINYSRLFYLITFITLQCRKWKLIELHYILLSRHEYRTFATNNLWFTSLIKFCLRFCMCTIKTVKLVFVFEFRRLLFGAGHITVRSLEPRVLLVTRKMTSAFAKIFMTEFFQYSWTNVRMLLVFTCILLLYGRNKTF